jgi:tetratricopeptide (TPR) repeat protein
MPVMYIPVIIVGIAALSIIGFVVASALAPKKIATLANYVKQGKYQAAVRTAKQLLQKEPRSTELHYLLGQAYLKDGKAELALMEFKTVNEIGQFGGYAPELDFRSTIADLFRQFGQPEEALKEYLLLMKRVPNDANYVFNAGSLFEDRGNPDRALEFYRKAISLNPKHAKAHLKLGLILYRGKHTVEAKSEFEAAIEGGNEALQAYYYLGRILKENHDYVAALVAFEKAQRDPEVKAKALVERGGCYMSLNSMDKAVTELERAIRLINNESSPESLYARYFLSLCFEKMRRFEDAISQWERIYAKKPAFRDVAEKLSQYQELRTDDRMKDFLTASQSEFSEICKTIVTAMDLAPQDVSEIPNGCQVIAVESESKWRNTRKMPRLVRVYRISDVVDVSTVRAMHEDMKKLNVMRGMLITSSRFSRSAAEFADTRPVELIDKERLQRLLAGEKITSAEKSPEADSTS